MIWKGKYFTYEEMTDSPTARRLGIDNTPGASQIINLQELVANVLDPLREAWGAPIIVTSGYRSTRLNSYVGGTRMSQHVNGQAADIRTLSDKPADNKRLRDLLIKLNLPFDQLIDEFKCNWLHVSYKSTFNRGQILSSNRVKGIVVYTPGVS